MSTSDTRPFKVNKRTLPNGNVVFYASFFTATGQWSPRKSTGKSTRGAAEKWCLQRLQDGRAVGIANADVTLSQYTQGFWGAGGRYDRQRKARGYDLSPTYLNNCKRSLEKYILPTFGKRRLHELTTAVLDAYFLDLFDEGELTGATVNNVIKSLRAPLADAERLGHIGRNPMKGIKPFASRGRERGALTQEELNKLFDPNAVRKVWKGNRQSMVLAMLCAGCGLRHGEAVAVRPMDIENGVLRVTRQWSRGDQVFKPPKWNSVREVPVPPRLSEEIKLLCDEQGIRAEGVLSTAPNARTFTRPNGHSTLVGDLRDALKKIGIPEADQKRNARFLDVHSLRHTYITRLRAEGVSDWEIQCVAGHKSVKMTDLYSHGRGTDYSGIAAVSIIPFTKRQQTEGATGRLIG